MTKQISVKFLLRTDAKNPKDNEMTEIFLSNGVKPDTSYEVLDYANGELLVMVGDRLLNVFPRHTRVTRIAPLEFVEAQ